MFNSVWRSCPLIINSNSSSALNGKSCNVPTWSKTLKEKKKEENDKKNQIDIALIDTAGRLQNKKNLMEEYKKIINVLKKIDPSYPNEVILVLDATTGQNALNQVEEFSKIHDLTGLIITKLDGTAKGGVVLAICKKYKLPIVAIGMGEKETDLHPFNAEYFSKALLGIED